MVFSHETITINKVLDSSRNVTNLHENNTYNLPKIYYLSSKFYTRDIVVPIYCKFS